jgi:hypothetical protein
MPGAQRVLTPRGERRQPCNALARRALQTATRTGAGTLPPSKTAARVSGGTLPMAQRFFALSGITPLTCATPAGCGAK